MAINYNSNKESKGWLVGGQAYWTDIDENDKPTGGYRSLGVVDSVDLSADQTTADLYSSASGQRQKFRSVITETNTELSIVLRDGMAKNVALILFGEAIENAEALATVENITAYLGKTIPLSGVCKDTTAVTVTATGGTPAYVAGDNFVVNNGSIFILEDQTGAGDQITDADELVVTYDKVAEDVIEGFVETAKTGAIYFEGENLSEDGEIVKVWIHKVTLTPTDSYQIMATEDFGSFQINGSALLSNDPSIPSGKSKIYKEVRQNKLI